MEILIQDLRYAIRRLRKTPALTATIVVLLALGIGATTSIFTLVYALIFRSLAVANPSELYRLGRQSQCCLWTGYSQAPEFSMVSYELYKHFRDNTKGFANLAAFQASESLLGVRRFGDSNGARSYGGEFVSGNYFLTFGIPAYIGRLLMASDDERGAPAAAVMSYHLWHEFYSSDPSIVGGEFFIDGKPFTLIGVTPPAFFGDRLRSDPPDFYLPLSVEPSLEANASLNKADTSWLDLIGRVQPGTNPATVQAQMRLELKRWLQSHWSDMRANDRIAFPRQTLYLTPGGAGITSMRQQYEHWLHILMIVSGLVFTIVCANVANLMLVRALERRGQIALSVALGARVPRMVGQVLNETILTALLGGALSLPVAFAVTGVILHFAFPPQSGMAGIPIRATPSAPVMIFTFCVALIAAILCGLAPAWLSARANPLDALRGAGRSVGLSGRTAGAALFRKSLVVCQAALSLVLLSASGLLMMVLHHLETQSLGFDESRRLVVDTNPRLAGYHLDQLTSLYGRIEESLTRLPGVARVALCSYAPLQVSAYGADIYVEGRPQPGPNDDSFSILNRVTPGFFSAIGTSVVRGREIDRRDTAGSQHVAVVNEAFARKFFPHEDAIGKYFSRWAGGAGQYKIVGVVKDAYYWVSDLGRNPTAGIFLPEAQHDFRANEAGELSPGTHFLSNIIIEVRPGTVFQTERIRTALASIDPNLPVISIQSIGDRNAGQYAAQRLIARLTSVFGLLSLILAAVGLYGVTAFNVNQRVAEIGVRFALGASRKNVIALMLQGALGLIAFGLLLGWPLTVAAGRFLGSQLYGMEPYSTAVTATSAIALLLPAIAAALLPALRASSISPMEALRSE